MLRKIITIDEDKCTGCGDCIPNCKENALQIIDGKARLVGDVLCDGLGACLGHCPEGAITVIEREAGEYSERKVIETILDQAPKSLADHLEHLLEHNETQLYNEAINILEELEVQIPINKIEIKGNGSSASGCPGSATIDLRPTKPASDQVKDSAPAKSELTQWPVQLHLVSPMAPYFKDRELVIMSTCGPVASADVHRKYLKNRSVVVACPKLDYTEPYLGKLAEIYAESATPRVIVVIMEVPCCKGLAQTAVQAAKISGREDIIVEEHTMALDGSIKNISILYHN